MNQTNKPSGSKKTLGSYPYFTVMLSITLSLIVTGLFGLIYVHAHKISEIARENIEMNIILNKSIQENQRISLEKALSAQPYILKRNGKPIVRFISAEEARKKFIEIHGQDFSKVLPDNPLHASFVINLLPSYSDSLNMKKIAGSIQKMDGVKEVFYMEDLIQKVNNNLNIISIVLLFFAFVLLFATILLINNTIKLALYSQRFLIRSMQLVGATKAFIQKPFIIRALLQGFISGCAASGLLFIIINYAYQEISYLNALNQQESILIVLGSLLLLGAIIGFFSSLRAVSKYLKMSLDELY
jgi:cell division transport system permease protein